jgi:hypothetical protein
MTLMDQEQREALELTREDLLAMWRNGEPVEIGPAEPRARTDVQDCDAIDQD